MHIITIPKSSKMKCLFFVLFMLFTYAANSQVEYTTYDAANKAYQIDLSYKDTIDYIPWIILRSSDDHNGGFSLKRNQIQPFLDALFEAQMKYEEWTEVAIKNNVEFLQHKDMKIKAPLVDAFYAYDGEWKFKFNIPLTFQYVITKQGDEVLHLLYISTGVLQTNDALIQVGALYQYFRSPEQMEQLSFKLSNKEIVEFIKSPKNEDLFKD